MYSETFLNVFSEMTGAAIDSANPDTRDFAASIAKDAPGYFNVGQVCLIFKRLRAEFKYVSDPDVLFDFVSPASRTIALGLAGDCDDLAVLTAALIASIGGAARVIVGQSSVNAHAYAEVFIGGAGRVGGVVLPAMRRYYPDLHKIHCHLDFAGGHWMNLDAIGRRHPGGVLYGPATEWAIYADGRYEKL